MFGSHCIKSWSTTQATIALSSAEAELYALLKASTQTLGLLAIAEDFGYSVQAAVHTDASATLGIVNRQGLGKLRHIGVQYLWMQEKVRNGEVKVLKVPGAENPADLCTKHLSADTIQHLISLVNAETTADRASSAPMLARATERLHGGMCVYATTGSDGPTMLIVTMLPGMQSLRERSPRRTTGSERPTLLRVQRQPEESGRWSYPGRVGGTSSPAGRSSHLAEWKERRRPVRSRPRESRLVATWTPESSSRSWTPGAVEPTRISTWAGGGPASPVSFLSRCMFCLPSRVKLRLCFACFPGVGLHGSGAEKPSPTHVQILPRPEDPGFSEKKEPTSEEGQLFLLLSYR